MKRKSFRLFAILLVLSMLCAIPVPVAALDLPIDTATPRASYYIASTYASISENNGTVTVSFDIAATGKMTSLGATMVRIKDSNGTTVKTFYSTNTNGMMGSNCSIFYCSVTYYGTSGKQYYAVVSFKAENSSGSDTTSFTTNYT